VVGRIHIEMKPHVRADRAGSRTGREYSNMNAIGVIAAASTGIGAAATVITAWLRARSLRQQAREKSRREYLRSLPGGSRVVDLGDHGVVIEVGPGGSGAGNEGDESR
jgi:hypothetical protein